jgi:uncharacterized protein YbjT (DUF2867 family)
MLFDGAVIVLAGATGRAGGATLRQLHDEGARVVVVSRSLKSAAASIKGYERASAGLADTSGRACHCAGVC